MNRLLPAFEFTALIASNHVGAVYLAKQRSLDRDVAIKILSASVTDKPHFVESFQSTARTMARLNHPNLIGVYDSGLVEEMLYFVMEFVPGKSLERSSQGQKVEFNTATRLVEGISDGLSHAHAHGIVHGNLDPSNILLNQKAEPKIGNFGFSHTSGEQTSGKVEGGAFRAPELVANPSAASEKSDIFSVGAILYQLLTGTPHSQDAPPPSSLCHCSPGIDAIWKQATQPDPALRYQDMRSFRVALSDFLKHPRPAMLKGPPASQRLGVLATPPDSQRLGARPLVVPPDSQKLGVRPLVVPPDSQRLGPRAAVPGAAPPTTAKLKSSHVGVNWKLIRNLFIIAGLLYAISLAWDNYKNTSAKRDKENKEAIAKAEADKQKAIEDARKRKLASNNRPLVPDQPPDQTKPTPTPADESPAESLERLRHALADGERTEMPSGSVRQGECDYFLVTEAMTWPEATEFAERHGGHLVIPNAGADLTWLVKNVSAGNGIWIGAARSGRTDWTLVDGLSWKPKKEPTGSGTYLSIDKHGFLKADDAKTKLPFVIQWHRNGKNPGTLTALLANTRSSIGKSAPVFPPGTRFLDNRNYLYIARPMMWRQAVDLAESSGGHLVVASETGEISHLSELTKDIAAPSGIWLGGFRKGDNWVWITGEPWKTAKWADDADSDFPDSALVLQPGKGWLPRNLSETTSGLIIEWSNDRKTPASSSSNPTPGNNSNAEVTALTARAKALILAADQKREEQLTANSRRFPWDLDIYLRNLPKSEQAIWAPHVNRLKTSVSNNRVPASIPKSSGIQLSKKMADLAQESAAKQNQIDSDFLAEAERIRTAFVSKITDSVTKADQAGQRALSQALADTLDSARNLEDWIGTFGIVAQPPNPELGSNKNTSTNGGTGLIPIPRTNGNNGPDVE